MIQTSLCMTSTLPALEPCVSTARRAWFFLGAPAATAPPDMAKERVSFTARGKKVSFRATKKARSKRSPKQVKALMKRKNMHTLMIENALVKMK